MNYHFLKLFLIIVVGLLLFSSCEESGEEPITLGQTFGGSSIDWGNSIQQTTDGGYIISGGTESFGKGESDIWLIKTDSQGQEEWNQTLGGKSDESGKSVQQTSDGGYIVSGTRSLENHESDIRLIKTDSNGNEEWSRTFGKIGEDRCGFAQQTSDGGYIITGTTNSVINRNGNIWLIKTDSNGNEEWSHTFWGGSWSPSSNFVQQTTDGGYIITGQTGSFMIRDADGDVLLIKTDPSGTEEWSQTFGGSNGDYGYSVQQTPDGGYIVTGGTISYGNGEGDVWLIKTDSNGDEEWNQTFGGSKNDYGSSVKQTIDGGYIVTGTTRSFGNGEGDVWFIKTDSEGNAVPNSE